MNANLTTDPSNSSMLSSSGHFQFHKIKKNKKRKRKSPVTSPLESRCQSASRSSSQFTTESFQSFSISCHATRQLPGILYRQKKLGHVQINKNEGEKYNYVPLLFISPILPSDYENHANLILPSPRMLIFHIELLASLVVFFSNSHF